MKKIIFRCEPQVNIKTPVYSHQIKWRNDVKSYLFLFCTLLFGKNIVLF